MSEEPSFTDDRWVRIMCDVFCDGVWHKDGCAGDADGLPIPTTLIERIRRWQATYDILHDRSFDAGKYRAEPGFIPFAAEGLEIARAVKAALPDWTVIYFDERLARTWGQPRPDRPCQYEITLPGPNAP